MGDFQPRSQFDNRERFDRYGRPRTDYMGALTNAAQQHPVAAALIGMGVLWLFAGGNRITIGGGDGRESIFGLAGEGASRAGSAVKSAADSVAGGVSSGLSAAAHAVSSSVSTVSGAVSDAAGAVSERVGHAAHSVGESVSSMAGGGGSQDYRNDMDDLYGESRSGSSRWMPSSPMSAMRQNVADVFDRYPLALAAAGLVLGAGAAATLPLTETEKSVMAKASEAAMAKAKEMGQQAADVASAALDEAGNRMGGNTASSSTTF